MTTLQPSYVKTADVLKSRMNLGKPFRIGRDNCRWVENPDAVGLKLAGYADELARRAVDHNGWYLDDDGSNDLARGIVFELPHCRGYVYGMADPHNAGPAIVCVDDIIAADDEIGAALAADHVAQVYAENERDYRRASDARMRFEHLAEEISNDRRAALDLIREIKALCRAGGSYTLRDAPNVEATLRRQLSSLRDDIAKAREERAELESNYSREDGWKDY